MIRVKAHRIRVDGKRYLPGEIITGLDPAEEQRLIEEGHAESVPSSDAIEGQTSGIQASGVLKSEPSPFLQMLHKRWVGESETGQTEDTKTQKEEGAGLEDGPNTSYPELSAKGAKEAGKQAKATPKRTNHQGKSARGNKS